MKQLNLIDWANQKKIILAAPPSSGIKTRAYVIEQLESFADELDRLEISPLGVAEAFAWYANEFSKKAQREALEE